MQKVLCPKCGATAYATEAFCPACGEMLKRPQPAPDSPRAVAPPILAPPPVVVPPQPPVPTQPLHPAVQKDRLVTFPLSDLMTGGLEAHEVDPQSILFSIENEEGAVALVGTIDSVLVLRSGDFAGGYLGINVRVYPYGCISEVKHTPGPITGKIQFNVHMYGGKPEIGRRAKMSGQKKVEVIAAVPNDQMPFVVEKFQEMVANLSEL